MKALPETTYPELESAFRSQNMNVHLIAVIKEPLEVQTIVNLQGKIDCKFQIQYHFSAKPRRGRSLETWPASPEENLERLKDAGVVEDRHVPMCSNCKTLGHSARFCKEEKQEREKYVVKVRLLHSSKTCG